MGVGPFHEVVYNFLVAELECYSVGEAGFLVHNGCPGAKRGPSTDPNAPHNATIRAEAAKLKAEGNTIEAGGGGKERLVQTPGGFKDARRSDILFRTPSGELKGVNVGRVMADGSPVPREVKALADLNGPGRLPTTFVPYTP